MTFDSLPQRIQDNITFIPESGCWVWLGALTYKGYGITRWGDKKKSVHRLMYEYLVKKIPNGLCVDHLCRVRCCVNPSHMEIVTPVENTMRGYGVGAVNTRKIACHNGHPYGDDNLYIEGTTGRRRCKICMRNNLDKYRGTEKFLKCHPVMKSRFLQQSANKKQK